MRNDTKKWRDDFAPKKLAGTHMPISEEVAAAHGHAHTAAEGDAIARKALQSMLKDALPAAIAKTQAEINQAAAELRVDADLRFGQVQELCDEVDGWLRNKSERHGHAELTIPLAKDRTTAAETYNASQRAVIDAAEKIRQKKLEIAASIEEYSKNFSESGNLKPLQDQLADGTLPVRVMARGVSNDLRRLAANEFNGFKGAFVTKSSSAHIVQLDTALKELNLSVQEALNNWSQHFRLLDGTKPDGQAIPVREQFNTLTNGVLKAHTGITDCNQKLKENKSFSWIVSWF